MRKLKIIVWKKNIYMLQLMKGNNDLPYSVISYWFVLNLFLIRTSIYYYFLCLTIVLFTLNIKITLTRKMQCKIINVYSNKNII